MTRGAMARRALLRWSALYLGLLFVAELPGGFIVERAVRAVTLAVIHGVADPAYVPPEMTGSGDTLLDWFRIPVTAALAAIGAALWLAIDRRRRDDRVLRWATWVGCRYLLALVVSIYGIYKLNHGQFPELSLDRLMTSYGESSPMGLLWTFMGQSRPYAVFTGIIELAGAALLLSRRTATLGAVVLVGAMAQVLALNLCYDVPVKLLSAHLLAIAIGIAATDWRRLVAVFGSNHAAPARDASPPLVGIRARWVIRIGRALALLYLAVSVVQILRSTPPPQPRSPLRGIHDVVIDGTGPAIWIRAVVDRGDRIMVWSREGRTIYRFELDGDQLRLFDRGTGAVRHTFRVRRTGSDELELADGANVLRLRTRDPETLALRKRGFQWVNEYPFSQ